VLENNSDNVLMLSSGKQLNICEIAKTDFTSDLIKKNRNIAYFANSSRSLDIQFENNGSLTVTPLLASSDNSYTSTTYEDVTQGIDEGKGNYTVAALSQDASHGSSVYVCGTTLLLQNSESVLSGQYSLANFDYTTNLTNYTLNTGDSFTVNKKMLLDGNITVSKKAANVIMIFVVFVLPLAMLLIGFIIWIKRRNL
jgi:hypothetical protein